jgi:hypothetical protein
MTGAKHTPGPWTLEDHGYTYIVSKPGDGYITRDVCRMDGSTTSAFNQKANAHLIVAAPEMLAALKEARAYYGEPDKSDPVDVAIWARIDAAIAKAEGRT